jgi:hypothetical protein
MNTNTKELLATFSGLGILAVLSLLNIPVAVGGLGSVGIYFGLKLLLGDSLSEFKNLPNPVKIELVDAVNKLDNIKEVAKGIKSQPLLEKTKVLENKTREIFLLLSKKPDTYDKISEVHRLLSSVESVITKYKDLEEHEISFKKKDAVLAETVSLMDSVNEAMDEYFKKGLKSDVLDLDVEIKVLKNKIENSKGVVAD